MKYVYLAGPITGTVQADVRPWRQYVSEKLQEDIVALSPMRDSVDTTDDFPLTIEKLRHGKGVVSRDRFDVGRCDLLFVNLLKASRVSIGTVGEIFWADAYRKPVILVMESTNQNPHFHLMLLELAAWRFDTLDEAIAKTNLLLSDLRTS